MSSDEQFEYNGLDFNSEIDYETISNIEFELDYFYDEDMQSFSDDYEIEIKDCYYRLNNILENIDFEIEVTEEEVGSFEDNYPSIERMLNSAPVSQYERDLNYILSEKVKKII